jgi:hypothetical protein
MKETIILSRREMQRMQVLDQVVRKTLSLKAGAILRTRAQFEEIGPAST